MSTIPTGGLFETLSTGWNSFSSNVGKTYDGLCNLTNAGWQKLMSYSAVQKVAEVTSPVLDKVTTFANEYYPQSWRFNWSWPTSAVTVVTTLVAGGILRARQTEAQDIQKQIDKLEATQKALQAKVPAEDLTAVQMDLLDSLKDRLNELQAPKNP